MEKMRGKLLSVSRSTLVQMEKIRHLAELPQPIYGMLKKNRTIL